MFVKGGGLSPFCLLNDRRGLQVLLLTTTLTVYDGGSIDDLCLNSSITFRRYIKGRAAFATVPSGPRTNARKSDSFIDMRLELTRIMVTRRFYKRILLRRTKRGPRFRFNNSVYKGLRIYFNRALIVTRVRGIPDISTKFPRLRTYRIRRITGVGHGFRAVGVLILINNSRRRTSIRRVFFMR